MATATKFERTQKSFPRGTKVSFIAGRGHKYIGIVKSVEDDSYLVVKFTNRFDQKTERRVNPKGVSKSRARA